MPRTSKVEMCMLCGDVPCSCGKTTTTKQPAVRRKATEPTQSTKPPEGGTTLSGTSQRASARDAMRKAASKKKGEVFAERHLTPPPVQSVRQAGTREDVLLGAALRALAPLLCEEDRSRFAIVLSSTPTVHDRATVWRARHVEDSNP